MNLQKLYQNRFTATREYRDRVWQVLTRDFFSKYIGENDTVLDLGCGYGEFINHIRCARRVAMDLNTDARAALQEDITFVHQDCSTPWHVGDATLDVVFSSNFFEHLPDKAALSRTIEQARRCLKPGGKLIALGPNIRFVQGSYWDFWDHSIPLTERSLAELLQLHGFELLEVRDRFLPYTLVDAPKYPLSFLRLYLKLPFLFRIFGKQFLVVAKKPESEAR